ncbi:MAG: DUF4344 domain-containing metallopeptidase [Pseudomonadota bacterium]
MLKKATTLAALIFGMVPFSVRPDAAQDGFVTSNIRAIFYHELGHAVIDVMEVPIFGQEEDAADVMSVLLIDWLFEEEVAQIIAYDSAFGFLDDPEKEREIAWWDQHGPDEQRFYNHVCLFYGGNPDARGELAKDLGLPEERAETCLEEYDLAAGSWALVFEEMDRAGKGAPMTFIPGTGKDDALVNQVLSEEVARMSESIALPTRIEVRVEVCEEANAFYDLEKRSIIFCTEFVDHLRDLFDRNFQ